MMQKEQAHSKKEEGGFAMGPVSHRPRALRFPTGSRDPWRRIVIGAASVCTIIDSVHIYLSFICPLFFFKSRFTPKSKLAFSKTVCARCPRDASLLTHE